MRDSLDNYDVLPKSMINYFRHNGRHFNKKLLNFALSKMYSKDSSTGEVKKLKPFTIEEVDNILSNSKINLRHNELYDYVYIANMCKADFYESSIPDINHLAKFIKDVIDDEDGYDGLVFNRWYADMCRKGIPIDWDNML